MPARSTACTVEAATRAPNRSRAVLRKSSARARRIACSNGSGVRLGEHRGRLDAVLTSFGLPEWRIVPIPVRKGRDSWSRCEIASRWPVRRSQRAA